VILTHLNLVYEKTPYILKLQETACCGQLIMTELFRKKTVRIGGNRFGSQTEEKKYLNILCESGILLGGPRLYFDPGIGYTWFPSEGSNALIIRAGTRFQGKNGLMMRLGLLGITLDS
jgi:hypothetical protein